MIKIQYKNSLLLGFCFGLIKSTLVQFVPFDDVTTGSLSIIIAIILLIILLRKSILKLKAVVLDYTLFVFGAFLGGALLTYLYNIHNIEIIAVLLFEIGTILYLIILTLLVVVSRISRKHFVKLSSIILLFFIGFLIFAIFNQEKIQEFKEIKKRQHIEVKPRNK
ncbi:hypothetical protein [uncultured Draconibacterium sp.]|uniref:hypothetical protein n=1 Tax=uncultured Draconibacterium sp. TaxID=1573823 RepID=UPI002AA85005|nr:hypothetical protein [uncultured Draconibacterium sp.]